MPMLDTGTCTVAAPAAVSPEFSARPVRRTFTAKDKLRIITRTGQATGSGDIGAIPRREGIYSSTLCDWRRQRNAGASGALTPVPRGSKAAEANPLAAEVALLQRCNADLTRRLVRAETIIDVQKSGGLAGADAGRPAHTPCRPRRADESESHRVPAGGPRRDTVAQQAAHFERQSLLGKRLQNAEISAALSQTLRLHRGRQKFLPGLLRLVQPGPSPRRDRPDDPRPGMSLRRRGCTTARSMPFTRPVRPRSTRRSGKTRNASSKNRPFHPPNQPPRGSTRPRRKKRPEWPGPVRIKLS